MRVKFVFGHLNFCWLHIWCVLGYIRLHWLCTMHFMKRRRKQLHAFPNICKKDFHNNAKKTINRMAKVEFYVMPVYNLCILFIRCILFLKKQWTFKLSTTSQVALQKKFSTAFNCHGKWNIHLHLDSETIFLWIIHDGKKQIYRFVDRCWEHFFTFHLEICFHSHASVFCWKYVLLNFPKEYDPTWIT